MAKGGRNRVPQVPREANGRIDRKLRDKAPIKAVQRDLAIIRAMTLDRAYGTPAGYLLRTGEITSSMFDAAIKLVVLRDIYERAWGLPRRNPKAQEYGKARGMQIEDDPDPERAAEHKKAVGDAWDAAEAVLLPGSLVHRAVHLTCIAERFPEGHQMKLALKDGLKRLCTHWGLT
jgi:hypothetical protein